MRERERIHGEEIDLILHQSMVSRTVKSRAFWESHKAQGVRLTLHGPANTGQSLNTTIDCCSPLIGLQRLLTLWRQKSFQNAVSVMWQITKLNKLSLTIDIHVIYFLSSSSSIGYAASVPCRIWYLGPRYLQELPSIHIQSLGAGNNRSSIFVPCYGRKRDSLSFAFQIYKVVKKRWYLCGKISSFNTRRDYIKRQNNSIKALVYKFVEI